MARCRTSNGESAAGDGRPITIGGVVYGKGLGVHAPSTVAYYTGRSCETVSVRLEEGIAGVEVRDDGRGGADAGGGSGLRGLADRVEAIGGSLEVENAMSEVSGGKISARVEAWLVRTGQSSTSR